MSQNVVIEIAILASIKKQNPKIQDFAKAKAFISINNCILLYFRKSDKCSHLSQKKNSFHLTEK